MKILFLIIGLLSFSNLFGQSNPIKHDNVWLFGFGGDNPNFPTYGDCLINFSDGVPNPNKMIRKMDMDATNASVSDKNGKLLFYTNGFWIANSNQDTLEGGNRINPDSSGNHARQMQGIIILPKPQSDSIYYIIHEELTHQPSSVASVSVHRCYYSVIDAGANNGLGKVLSKNNPLVFDSLCYGKVTATKHGNGRDWWLFIPTYDKSKYYRYLLNPKGIDTLPAQTLGSFTFSSAGQAAFSPNGEWYCKANSGGTVFGLYIDLYKFDRCSGGVYNHLNIRRDTSSGVGVAFSPNSRFLYVSSGLKIYQYDLWSPDIEESERIIVAQDVTDPQLRSFFLFQLAPDGRIYFNNAAIMQNLNVIDNPNLPGNSCGLKLLGFPLPTMNEWSMPNFPNYRLGPLDGSPCDTLGLDNHPVAWWLYEQDSVFGPAVAFRDLSYFEPAQWAWDFGEGTSSTEPSPFHVFLKQGVYHVCLTVSNLYGADTFCRDVVVGTDALAEASEGEAILVFPNPVKDRLAVALPNDVLGEKTLIVFDMLGKPVLRAEANPVAGQVFLEVGGLPAGMYALAVSGRGGLVGKATFLIVH